MIRTLRYILDKSTMRIWFPSGTTTSMLSTRWSWITQRLILNQHHEILNVSTIEWRFTPWMKSTLLHDKVIKWADAKVHVYSNSVLCLVRMHGHPEAKEKWKDPFQLLQQSNGCWELFGLENQLSSSGIFDRTYNIGDSQRDPGQKFRGFSMSSHLHVHVNDINWTKTGHCNECFSNSEEVKIFAKRFPLGHWSFFGPGEEGNWYGTHNCKPAGQWILTTADVVVENYKDSGHSAFWATGPLGRSFLSKEGGRSTIHISAEPSNADLLFRTHHSANHLSIYGTQLILCHSQAWRNPSQLERCWFVQSWSLKKWIRWYRHWGRVFKKRETDCKCDESFSSLWISWIHEESLFRTIVQNHSRWDLEVRQACKRVYSFVIIQILKLLCGSVDTKIGRVLQIELMEWAASKNMEACFRRSFINLLRVECWEELIFSRMEIWWNDGS